VLCSWVVLEDKSLISNSCFFQKASSSTVFINCLTEFISLFLIQINKTLRRKTTFCLHQTNWNPAIVLYKTVYHLIFWSNTRQLAMLPSAVQIHRSVYLSELVQRTLRGAPR
jgi:hypothetical protein